MGESRSPAWAAGVPVVLCLAGVLFATSAATARGTDLRGSDTADLVEVIRRHSVDNERRAADVRRLRSEVDALTGVHTPGSEDLAATLRSRERIAPAAGTAPVRGPGLTVTLTDAVRSGELPDGVTPDDVVVHQQDVQGVVNALWAGGAEAMSIQDQRLVSSSAVRCVGNTLVLQGRVYSPPFVIRAVGDVVRMRRTLEHDRAVTAYREAVLRFGLGYEVAESDMTLPGYEGDLVADHVAGEASGSASKG